MLGSRAIYLLSCGSDWRKADRAMGECLTFHSSRYDRLHRTSIEPSDVGHTADPAWHLADTARTPGPCGLKNKSKQQLDKGFLW